MVRKLWEEMSLTVLTTFSRCRFLTQECSLLKYRLDHLSDAERAAFMESNGMGFDPVPEAEKNARKEQLVGLANINMGSFISTTYYKYASMRLPCHEVSY
jgi:hypothetical protein